MNSSTTIIVMLLSIGAFQGIIFGGIMLKAKGNRIANRLLAIILFLFAYRLIVQIMRLFGLGYYDGWYYLMLDLSWVNGALLYFYVKSQLTPEFKFKRSDWVHFIPLIIQIACSVFVRLQNLYWDGTKESLSWLGYWGYVVWMNNSTIYIITSLLIIFYAFKAEKLLTVSSALKLSIDHELWIKRILFSFKWFFTLVLTILLIDLIVYNLYTDKSYHYFIRFYYYPFFIGISVLTYWLGIEGFKRKDQGFKPNQQLSADKRKQLEVIASDLAQLMTTEQLFKEPDLSLRMVADSLQIKPYLLTNCLNVIIDKKFNDYINQLRIKEVQTLIKQPNNQRKNLLTLALEAGFNSKSSFNRAVKKHLGVSPRELKNQ